MKNKISRGLAFLGSKLGVYSLSAKYFADYPRLTRLFNKGLPIAMVSAVVLGLGIISWQIAGLARDGEVHVATINDGRPVDSNFEARVVFKASQDRQPFNIRMFLDGRVISSKVGSAINKDEVRDYKFASGVNGENKFDVNLLSPGEHTLRVEAKTGSIVGQGTEIDADNINFRVSNVVNLLAMGEPAKAWAVNQLPGAATPRSSAAPLPGLPEKLSSVIFPKVEAHSGEGKRHGHIKVITRLESGQPVPGVPVQVGHPVLDQCHEGNSRTTDGNGVAIFTNCPVSNIGGTDATYAVHVGDTPAGYTIATVHDRTMTVRWNQTSDINFVYNVSAAAQPAQPQPQPQAPANPVYNYDPPGHKPMIALTGLTATQATVDAFGMKMADNNVINQLAKVSANIDGNEVSSVTSFTPYATQSGIQLNLPDLNALAADNKEHTLNFIATNANGESSSLEVKITPPDSGSPAVTGGAPAQPSDPATQTNNPHKGSIAVSVYAHKTASIPVDEAKDPRVGGVYITATNIGSNVGQCQNRQNGTTNNDRGSGDGFGRIHFRDCPAALSSENDHAKKYRITASIPDGFDKTETNAIIEREVTVKKDEETKVRIVLVGSNSNTVGPAASTGGSPAPNEDPAATVDRSKPFAETGPNAKGYLLIYSDKGRFDRYMISVDTAKGPTIGGIPNTAARCGDNRPISQLPDNRILGSFINSGGETADGRQAACSASAFYINFFRPGESINNRGLFENPRVAASVTPNHCTYVRYGEVTRIAPIKTDGQCPAVADIGLQPNREDTRVTGKYNPLPYVIGQAYTYEHELALANNGPMSPVECAGSIRIVHVQLNDPGRSYPIRYWYDTAAQKGRCTFKQQVTASYSASLCGPQNEQLRLIFDGNSYLKPTSTIINNTRDYPAGYTGERKACAF